jgi:GAF domain-containing protein
VAALSRFFVGDGTLQETLDRVADLTVEAIGPAAFAGITMPVEGRERTAVFTDPEAPEIDQAQYDTGEGPCLDSYRHGTVVRIDSTLEDGQWPAFRAACAGHGILSTLSLPLVAAGTTLGAMNLYAREERAFSHDDRDAAERFAAQAAVVLGNARAYWDARELGERLGEAMRSRAAIEQAKGVLMASQRCSEDEAFDLLVRASQRENVKLRDIAQRIVAGVQRPRPDPAGGEGGAAPRPGAAGR